MSPERAASEASSAEPAAQPAVAQPALASGAHGGALGQAIRSGLPISNRALSRWLLQRTPSGDDLQARAQQALAGEDWSSAATDLLERIVSENFPELRGIVAEFRWDPAAAQTGPDETGRAVRMVDGVLVGGDILVRWVANGFLQDAVAETGKALQSGAAAPTPAAPSESATGYRAEIVKLINSVPDEGIIETLEGGLKGFMSAKDIATNREQMGAGWTSCIGFQGSVLEQAKTAFLKKNKRASVYTNVKGNNADANAPKHNAWYSGSSGYKPKPGDMYRLNFVEPATKFSHIGFIKDVKPGTGGMETWVTVDGGQRKQRGDPDKIALKTRSVDRARQLVKGGENADPDDRLLVGFVNVDALVS